MAENEGDVHVYVPSADDLANPCVICNVIFDGLKAMVECETCLRWFHNECVGAKELSTHDHWNCITCKAKAIGTSGSSNQSELSSVGGAGQSENNSTMSSEINKLKELLNAQKKQIDELIGVNKRLLNSQKKSLEHQPGEGARKKGIQKKTARDSSGNDNHEAKSGRSRRSSKGFKSKSKRKDILLSSSESEEEEDSEDDGNSSGSEYDNRLTKYLAQQELKELPYFDGSPNLWPSFYRSFKESRKLFSDTANRNRLQKALSGRALRSVAGLLLSPSTLDEAVKMLKYRFGQSEQIIQESIDQALAAEPPCEKKPETIVDYAMLVVTINANIKAVGESSEQINPMLVKILVERLPFSLQKRWSRKKREMKNQEKLVKVSTFSKWLLAESNDYVDLIQMKFNDPKVPARNKKSIHLHQSQSTILEEPKRETRKAWPCLKCAKENHVLGDCAEFQQMSLEDRRNFTERNGICFVCLRKGHRWRRCFRKDAKGKRVFHRLLQEASNFSNESPSTSQHKRESNEKRIESAMTHYSGRERSLFKVVPVIIHGPVSQFQTYALLDDCASVTLIEEDVAQKLMLNGPIKPLVMGWTKDIVSREDESKMVKFYISGIEANDMKYRISNARTVKHLSLPEQSVSAERLRNKYPYLSNAGLTDLKQAVPTILIGIDNANLIAPLEVRLDPNETGPVAIRNKLGWTVHGPEYHYDNSDGIHYSFLLCECESRETAPMELLMDKYFSSEDFGVKVPAVEIESRENRLAKEILMETTKRNGDRFQTGLLWNHKNVKMPDNYSMCLRRLTSIEIKMERHPEFKKAYIDKIEEYVTKGYARKLDAREVEAIKGNMWLLPHFGVSTPSKPKMRLVFDAKATFGGVSLNSQLLTGPDQYNSLVGVIFKFRQGRVAVAADIMEMFHQIKIKEEDRRFQCFLWRGGEKMRQPDIYMMEAMIFGAKCSPCSAQFVKNENAREFIDSEPRAVQGIIENFYVDDYMDSFETAEFALEITRKVIEINRQAGFKLRNVISNSKLVVESLSARKEAKIVSMNLENEPSTEKVLGLFWDTGNDEFLFKLKINSGNDGTSGVFTKRQLLRSIMSIFDPVGFLAHYTVRAKILMQDVWMKNIADWDIKLPSDIQERWLQWCQGLKSIESMRIERCYSKFLLRADRVELHVFTDASERAFAAVAYIRIEYGEEVHVCLVSAKTKIASQKASKILSMPRMELQGGLLGSRLATMLITEHSIKIDTTTFWTDSQTVLSWLFNENNSYKSFVAHRISEILETTRAEQWRYVDTGSNPADDATKETKIEPFDVSSRWFQGPPFLRRNKAEWPVDSPRKLITIEDPEVRKVFVVRGNVQRKFMDAKSIIKIENFSDWLELRRITSWLFRAIRNWIRRKQNKPPINSPLSLMDLEETEKYYIRISQFESFPEELRALRKNIPVSYKSKIRDLLPYIDDEGIMRMEGRIETSPNAPWSMKRPIILCRTHHLTRLILHHYHVKFCHQFQESVVNEVRAKYWIPQIRVAVKSVRNRCQECRNNNAVPNPPQMSKLPFARTEGFLGCFHHCGVDLFGPMFVIVKRSIEKRWGVVFTCLATRAIYTELVPDLSADSLILAIRNCHSRRGPINHLYSDCGTNLKGAKSELRQALDEIAEEKLQRECIKREIVWHFNPPASPHMGGCWERMVRSIKSVLKTLMKERHLKEHTLRSFLCEVEDVINTRPLTYIAIEKDTDDALTPKHFLNPYFRNTATPLGEFSERDLTSKKQWRVTQELVNHFWRRWVAEYLPMLSRTSKWHEKVEPLKIGDIVVICDNLAPRNTWEKGIVVDIGRTAGGQVRSATVKTTHGILIRPSVKLAKLDVYKEAVNTGVFTKGGVTDDLNLAP